MIPDNEEIERMERERVKKLDEEAVSNSTSEGVDAAIPFLDGKYYCHLTPTEHLVYQKLNRSNKLETVAGIIHKRDGING